MGPKSIKKSIKLSKNEILYDFWGRGAQGRLQAAHTRWGYCTFGRLLGRKWGPKGRFWEPFWSQNRSKMDAKIDTKIDAEKVSKMMPK